MTQLATPISVRRPLEDPSSDIRLLYLHAGDPDSPICCTISNFKLNQAPSFRAISYTWGPPTPEAFIHLFSPLRDPEMVFKVRENARYALWQARLHYPDSYIWIDSVSIDQECISEKGAQVEMMGVIYRKASGVLACIGPEDESSKIVTLVARKWFSMLSVVPNDGLDGEDADDWANYWKPPRDVAKVAKFLEHWNRFSAREYFHRLWIVQELSAGKLRTTMLCGSSIVNWDEIVQLQLHLVDGDDVDRSAVLLGGIQCSEQIGELRDFLALKPMDHLDQLSGPAPFDWLVLQRLLRFHCQDPRDRLYGTSGVVNWGPIGVSALPADYSLSRFDLGLRQLPKSGHVDIHFARSLSLVLNLENEDQHTKLYRRARQHNRHLEAAGSTSCSWLTELGALGIRTIRSGGVHIIRKDDFGRLCLDLNKWPDGERPDWSDNVRSADVVKLLQQVPEVFGSIQSPYKNGQKPINLFSGNEVSALAWPDVQPGDMVFGNEEITTILRCTDDETCFQVVGKVLLLDGYSTHNYQSQPLCLCWPKDQGYKRKPVLAELSEVSNFDALLHAAVREGARDDAAVQVQLLSLDFPPLGSIVKDRTSADWQSDQFIRPLELSCTVHDAKECNRWRRNGIRFVAASGIGMGLEVNQRNLPWE